MRLDLSVSLADEDTLSGQTADALTFTPALATDYNALAVKPIDGSACNIYANSDHAGAPENYKAFVTGGATGAAQETSPVPTPPPPLSPHSPALRPRSPARPPDRAMPLVGPGGRARCDQLPGSGRHDYHQLRRGADRYSHRYHQQPDLPNNFTIARAYTVTGSCGSATICTQTITVFASQGATALPISLGQAADYSVLALGGTSSLHGQIEVYQSATVINGNVGAGPYADWTHGIDCTIMAESIMIPPILPDSHGGRSPVAFIRSQCPVP